MVMLIIQYHCGYEYESKVMAPETELNIGAELVVLQKPFIVHCKMIHNTFNFY